MGSTDLTIIIVSADSYVDIFGLFVFFLRKNWSDCPYRIIYSNERLDVIYDGIETIHSGENSAWSTRARNALKLITTNYVLLLCDDLFITEPVDQRSFESFIDELKSELVSYCRLLPLSDSKKIFSAKWELYNLDKSKLYGINLMAGIYEKSFMQSVISQDNLTGWQIERLQNDIARSSEKEWYSDKLLCNRNYLNLVHCIRKGKWIRKAKKIVVASMSGLLNTQRKTESYILTLKNICKGKLSRFMNVSLHH